jgi:hypothetical protein
MQAQRQAVALGFFTGANNIEPVSQTGAKKNAT